MLLVPLATLLTGVGMLVIGTGLLFPTIGAHVGSANFPVIVTGLINSAYFGGFVAGTFACPAIIRLVGPIRAFAALASIASTLPILHALWLNPWYWGGLRFLTGGVLMGLFLVAESWLVAMSPSHQRGKVFAAYMSVCGVGMAVGQWLILAGDKFGFVPFAMASILFSFALLPITLVPLEEPEPTEAPKLSLIKLFAISPIGVIGAVTTGVLNSSFFALGNVFGQRVGFSDAGAATFMAATILGGAAFQWPVGHLSDQHDRRWVLFWICVAGIAVTGSGFYLALESEIMLIGLGIVYGGLAFTIYGVSVAHVNDLIDRSRVLEVTGGLLLLYSAGATIGPTLGGAIMDLAGPGSLLLFFAGVLALLAMAVWYYIRARPENLGEPGHKAGYVIMGSGTQAVLKMDPRSAEPKPAAVQGEKSKPHS